MTIEGVRSITRSVASAGLVVLLSSSAAGGVIAAEPVPPPPDTAQAAHQVANPDGLRSRVLRDEPSPVRGLDSAIFTELLPVTASEPAVRLPEDQREDAPE